jgi:hypothetical protein
MQTERFPPERACVEDQTQQCEKRKGYRIPKRAPFAVLSLRPKGLAIPQPKRAYSMVTKVVLTVLLFASRRDIMVPAQRFNAGLGVLTTKSRRDG